MSAAEPIEAWRHHLETELRRSPHTVRAYVAAATRLMEMQDLHGGAAIAALDTQALRCHLAARRAEGIGNASAARELSAIKAFIAFVRSREGVDLAHTPRMRGPRLKKGLPRPITPDEFAGLIDHLAPAEDAGWTQKRDAAVLLLLYGAGLRIAEALSLRADALPDRRLADEAAGQTLSVTGKGGKQRIVPILPMVIEAVAAYRAACPHPLPRNGPLFVGLRGGPLSAGMVQKAMARARIALDLPASATPHALRHSFATHLLGAGADLRSLQELLGHASLGSTQIYTKVDAAQMLDAYRSAHPRERR